MGKLRPKELQTLSQINQGQSWDFPLCTASHISAEDTPVPAPLWPSWEPLVATALPGALLDPAPLELVEVGVWAVPIPAHSHLPYRDVPVQHSGVSPHRHGRGRVKAEDSDVGENTDMTYHLKEESGSGGHVFKVTTDSDTQEAIIVVQKVRYPQMDGGR